MIKGISFLAALLALQSTPYIVDLVVAPRSSDDQYLAIPDTERPDALAPVAITSHGAVPGPAPFEMQGVTLDRSGYSLGEEFLYEASIRYTGDGPITFPISSEVHRFRKSMPSLQVAAVAISFAHPSVGHQVQIAENLYGAETVPGTLITMATNQVVTIRGEGTWRLPSQRPFANDIWPLTVKPVLDFSIRGADATFSPLRYTMLSEVTLQRAGLR